MDRLCQHMTPVWMAEALVERHFPRLDMADIVIEPSCGHGSFLRSIPVQTQAIGVEIDPRIAAIARRDTGRRVIDGDFRTVSLDVTPTAIIGNPPFVADVFDGFLERSYELLPEGGRAGFILPTYFFQTASRVTRYAERWSILQELLPRNAFNGRMRTPLLFAVFSKDAKRTLFGFALYRETEDVTHMAAPYRDALTDARGSAWKAVCQLALTRLGGRAGLSDIYRELERNRPSKTRFWREKVRQTLRVYTDAFTPVRNGYYALRESF